MEATKLVIWKNENYKVCNPLDATQYENDPDWLMTLDLKFLYENTVKNESRPVDQLVIQKTADIETPVIMNITKEKYDRAMNLLDGIENYRIKLTIKQFLEDNDKQTKLIETIEVMQKTASEIKHTLSSFSV